jgi:hypothetical protein
VAPIEIATVEHRARLKVKQGIVVCAVEFNTDGLVQAG